MNKSLVIGFILGVLLVIVVMLCVDVVASNRPQASSSASVTSGISCMRSAVDAREDAIMNANADFEQQTNSIYQTRAKALDNAYSEPSWSDVYNATELAFSNFTVSITEAQSQLQTADNTTTLNYNKAVQNCEAGYPSIPQQSYANSFVSNDARQFRPQVHPQSAISTTTVQKALP